MIYFTSDPHWNHVNIIKYCNRPFSDVNIMNNTLIENWNSIVNQEDTIYQLGDFAFKNISYWLEQLNGNIINIRGNHERSKEIKKTNKIWHQKLDFDYAGYKFLLNHKPLFTFDDPDADKYANILDNYDYILCGHVHEKWKVNQKNINVGVDVWDFKPVSIDTIIELIKTLE